MKVIRDRVRKNIISLLKSGRSVGQIAASLGASKSTVSNIRRTILKDFKFRPSRGRPRVLTSKQTQWSQKELDENLSVARR